MSHDGLEVADFVNKVGEWAELNFGDNTSHLVEYTVRVPVALGSLAPLMGIVEELGELAEAVISRNAAEAEDAIGDIFIYLADFIRREKAKGVLSFKKLRVRAGSRISLTYDPSHVLSITIGRLYHVVLKGHQGIRGYDDPEKYTTERDERINSFIAELDLACSVICSLPLETIADRVWKKVISKRDWITNPEDGVSK